MVMRVFIATVAVVCCSPLAIADIWHGDFTITMTGDTNTTYTGNFQAQGNSEIDQWNVTSFTLSHSFGNVNWDWSVAAGGLAPPSVHQFYHTQNALVYMAQYSNDHIHFWTDGTGDHFEFLTSGSGPLTGTVVYGGHLTDDDGNDIPAPAAVCLFGLVGFASHRRRRS